MGPSIAGIQMDQEGKELEPALRPVHGADDWSVSGRPIRYLYTTFVILSALLMFSGAVGYRAYPHDSNDFFAFNSFSRFIRQHPPMLIYDQELLRHFQDLPHNKLLAFMYHPAMMLLLWPLAYLPYDVGYVLWVGIGLVACCVAIAGSRDGWPLALLVVVAPSTLWTALAGQSTLLLAALLIGGLLLSPRRPLLAGLLIGLATYKPQLGLLVPVALVAAGQWRTISAACATALCIVLFSILAFGVPVWLAWFHHLSSIIDMRFAQGTNWAPIQATVASNLMTAGVGWRLANTLQIITCVFSVICIWHCFRPSARDQSRNSSLRLEVAALGAATFLAAPYAFTYDLPLFTGAVLLFVDERRRAKGLFMFREVLAVVASMMVPCFILSDWLHSCSSVVITVMLCTILHRIWDLRREQDQSSRLAYLPLPVGFKA
ncbi:MAG: glycosyltransferase family 87 protein [Janthinobacterium lividum]